MKERLDVLLVNKGLFSSREKAKASIMAGIVFVDGQRSDKAGNMIDIDSVITIKDDICPYVSRGGLKLEKSMTLWPIDLNDKVCMDIGASTGGFTDCMLQNGATKVYAIDVGYGQLDYKLRIDPRVINMEKTNIRYLDLALIKDPISFISIDVSFISLKLVLPVASKILSDDGSMVCLVKPQFEAGKEQVGKNGIVRDINVHKEVLYNAINYAHDNLLCVSGLTFSPVKGAKGNIEYLIYLTKKGAEIEENLIETVTNNSHVELDK